MPDDSALTYYRPGEQEPGNTIDPQSKSLGETTPNYFAGSLTSPILSFRVDTELFARLLLAARARKWSPELLAVRLLTHGLDRESGRSQAEAALEILTPRERQVAHLTAIGRTNGQIAQELYISQETVKTHVRNALIKFRVRSKSELRLLLQDLGLPPSEAQTD